MISTTGYEDLIPLLYEQGDREMLQKAKEDWLRQEKIKKIAELAGIPSSGKMFVLGDIGDGLEKYKIEREDGMTIVYVKKGDV